MDRASEVQFWLDAAARRDKIGEHATAITFRNMAWLLEHPEGWHAATNPRPLNGQREANNEHR